MSIGSRDPLAPHRRCVRLASALALGALASACGAAEESREPEAVGEAAGGIIENTEDWDWIGFHTKANDPIYNLFPATDVRNSVDAARAVARMGASGCNGFLISAEHVMTADHCYRSAAGVLPSSITETVTFLSDTASPLAFTCTGPIQSDFAADVLTLRCAPDGLGRIPGSLITPVRVSRVAPVVGDDMFSITYNCRCDDWSTGCDTVGVPGAAFQKSAFGACAGPDGFGGLYRLLSPGGRGQAQNNRIKNCEVNNGSDTWTGAGVQQRGFNTNCDSLKGSSGGPVFDRLTGAVAGIVSHWEHALGTWNGEGMVWGWMRQADRDSNALLDGSEAGRKFQWRNWTSDGGASSFCPANQAVAGFECDGSYCDNVRILCEPVPGGTGVANWSPWFSEEQPGLNGCGANQVMTGIACSGDYCDNMALRCSNVTSATSCVTTAPFSEEDGEFVDFGNRFIRKIGCTGSYCDNLTFQVCKANAAVATCQGSCGGPAPFGCMCDLACDVFGDCCGDVVTMCR